MVKSITTPRKVPRDLALADLSGVANLFGQNRRNLGNSARAHLRAAGSEKDFLAPLGVDMIPGVGPKTRRALDQKGIKIIGDLLSRPHMALRYLDLDGVVADQHRHGHSIGNETTLDHAIDDLGQMEKVLWTLVEEVGSRLRSEQLYARCLRIKVRYSNFQTVTRSHTLLSPICFDREIFETVRTLLRQNIMRGRAVRLLGVSASALQNSGWQEPLLNFERRKSLERLYKGIDDLRRKYGEQSIGVASPRHRAD